MIAPLVILSLFLIGCASGEDMDPGEESISDEDIKNGLAHLDDEMLDGSTPKTIEAKCTSLHGGDEYEELFDECVKYGMVLPSAIDVFALRSGLFRNGRENPCSELTTRYSLSNIEPLSTKFQDPLKGTFFSAKLLPKPYCFDHYPLQFCYEMERDELSEYDICREQANDGLDVLGDEMNDGETIDYFDFCNDRAEYTVCGDEPHESAIEANEDYGNICSQYPGLNIIGFVSVDSSVIISTMFLKGKSEMAILSITPEEEGCSFEKETQNIDVEADALPCTANRFGALLFYSNAELSTLYESSENRSLNEYPFIFNSSSNSWKKWDTVADLLDIDKVGEHAMFSLVTDTKSGRDQRDSRWQMAGVSNALGGEFITFGSDIFECGGDD
jgi:hypothetical protein